MESLIIPTGTPGGDDGGRGDGGNAGGGGGGGSAGGFKVKTSIPVHDFLHTAVISWSGIHKDNLEFSGTERPKRRSSCSGTSENEFYLIYSISFCTVDA